MKTAEEILKSKLNPAIAILNNPDYTFNKVIEAMEEYANQFKQLHKPVVMQGSDSETQTYVDRGDRYEVKPYDPEFIKLPSVGQRSVGTNAEGEKLLCFCANGGREGLHGICTNCGNYVGSSREGHL